MTMTPRSRRSASASPTRPARRSPRRVQPLLDGEKPGDVAPRIEDPGTSRAAMPAIFSTTSLAIVVFPLRGTSVVGSRFTTVAAASGWRRPPPARPAPRHRLLQRRRRPAPPPRRPAPDLVHRPAGRRQWNRQPTARLGGCGVDRRGIAGGLSTAPYRRRCPYRRRWLGRDLSHGLSPLVSCLASHRRADSERERTRPRHEGRTVPPLTLAIANPGPAPRAVDEV